MIVLEPEVQMFWRPDVISWIHNVTYIPSLFDSGSS